MGEPRPGLRFEARGATVGGDGAVAVDELGEEGVHRRARDGLDALELARGGAVEGADEVVEGEQRDDGGREEGLNLRVPPSSAPS